MLTATNFTAQLWNIAGNDGKAAFVWTPGAQMYQARFTPDGAYVLTASEDRLARLWDVQTGKEAAALPHPRDVRYAAFSRDGKLLLTASDQQLRVWDVAALPQVPSDAEGVADARRARCSMASSRPDGREILASTSAAPPGCGTS